jgi:hypothetical protein
MDGDDRGSARAPAAERVGWGELWRWVAPWLGGALLMLVALLGLFVASRAEDEGTYIGGFAAAVIAVIAFIWRLRAAFAGDSRGALLPPLLVEHGEALAILVAVLVGLGFFGLFLAARGPEPLVTYGGYGLFLGALAIIFWNVKHYFDQLER